MVAGVPCMCMRIAPAPESRTISAIPSPCNAVTSFTMWAPAASACRATSALDVSTESITADCSASARTTGSTRCNSSSSETGCEPGRVDSPPMSSRSAPSCTSFSPCAMAVLTEKNCPPSEKLSGVTFTIPITSGRLISNTRSRICQRKVGTNKSNEEFAATNMIARNHLARRRGHCGYDMNLTDLIVDPVQLPRLFHQRNDLHGCLLTGLLQSGRGGFAQFRQEAAGCLNYVVRRRCRQNLAGVQVLPHDLHADDHLAFANFV